MPEYASFRLSLQSQYDAATISESTPEVIVMSVPSLSRLHCESPALSEQHPDKTFNDFSREGRYSVGTVIVQTTVPVLKGSQFWICYSCPPPRETPPPSDPENSDHVLAIGDAWGECMRDEVKYYYFKLFVSGTCFLSWGVGEEDNWRGKTIFGLFNGGSDFEGRRIVEKRGLFFPPASPAADGEGFEIRVFRAKARRREGLRYLNPGVTLPAGGAGKKGCRLEFTSVGKVQKGEPQRFYSYALIDAKEEPCLVFKYRFEREDGEDETGIESTIFSTESEDTTMTIDSDIRPSEKPASDILESSLWSNLEQNTPQHLQQTLISTTALDKSTRRLSFPPRNFLQPSTNRVEPSSPIKQLVSASDDDLSRPQVLNVHRTMETAEKPRRTGLRKEGWTASGASSEIGNDKKDEDVGQVHKDTGSGGLLKSVVAGALRRREKGKRARRRERR